LQMIERLALRGDLASARQTHLLVRWWVTWF
jgi:hypothetical protein